MGDLSCENELEELMHQIDVMVNSKKVEWQKRMCALEETLGAREQELAHVRGSLDHKDREIARLAQKLEEAAAEKRVTVKNHENQLEALRNQLCHLKKNYEKLHYHHVKHQRNADMGERKQSELEWLSQKLEEYKVQAQQREKQWILHQNNLKTLDEQRKLLAEKCDFFQEQSQRYQEELVSRGHLQEAEIAKNQSEINRLRRQLDACQETIRGDAIIMENLKSTLKETALSRDAVKEENQRLRQELRDCHTRCQRLESDLSEATIKLQSRDDLLKAVELDQRLFHKDMRVFADSQGSAMCVPNSDVPTKNRTPPISQVQRRLSLSPCKDLVGKDSCMEDGDGLHRLRADISDLTAKLNQKDVTIASISQKVSRLERELEVREEEAVHTETVISAAVRSDLCALPPGSEQEHPETRCHDVQEIQPESMKDDCWQSSATRAQSRTFNEESASKRLNTDVGISGTVLSDRTFHHRECNWDIQSLMVNQQRPEPACLHNGHVLPEIDLLDLSLMFVWDQEKDCTIVPDADASFITAAERFLQEENRRARDLENILNSHIEELQRNSECTVNKYTCHSRDIACS